MFEGIATGAALAAVANGAVSGSLDLYYATATHRQASTEIIIPQAADPVFRFSPEIEGNRFSQWRENTVDAIRGLIAHPETLERPWIFFRGMMHFKPAPPFLDTVNEGLTASAHPPIFIGHSAGGFTVYVLAAMAKGANLAGLKEVLPALGDIPDAALTDLAERLRTGLFIGVGAPLNGVQLTRAGRVANRLIVEPRVPLLFSGITRPNVEEVYRKLGKRPKEVMDGSVIATDHPFRLRGQGSLSSLAGHLVVQGGMRLFSPFLDHNTVNDGIVPLYAAFLEGIPQVLLRMDHLKLVETPEAARALVQLIARIERREWVLAPGGNGLEVGSG